MTTGNWITCRRAHAMQMLQPDCRYQLCLIPPICSSQYGNGNMDKKRCCDVKLAASSFCSAEHFLGAGVIFMSHQPSPTLPPTQDSPHTSAGTPYGAQSAESSPVNSGESKQSPIWGWAEPDVEPILLTSKTIREQTSGSHMGGVLLPTSQQPDLKGIWFY